MDGGHNINHFPCSIYLPVCLKADISKKRDILDVSEQDCAVILSVICEELRARPEELRITVIRKLAQEE
ncbi:MAG: hypothetical protein LUC99_01500 [Clostridiales bacterium]|nr:hypothetical protein [Clostridiales bacterium]